MTSTFADLTAPEQTVPGVIIKKLTTHADDRGFFREIIRSTDPLFAPGVTDDGFAQWSHSKMAVNTVKAWHFHHKQVDWWYVPIGVIEAVLYDAREESPTYGKKLHFKLGESSIDDAAIEAVVRIPQGVFHGCKVISDSAHLMYITSQVYDPADEGRHPFNSPLVPHSWGNNEDELIIATNDRKTHIPPYNRLALA